MTSETVSTPLVPPSHAPGRTPGRTPVRAPVCATATACVTTTVCATVRSAARPVPAQSAPLPSASPCGRRPRRPGSTPRATLGDRIRGLGRRRSREADEAAWEWFDETYRGWIRRRCRAYLHRSKVPVLNDEVEEVVQEVFCHLLEEDRRRLRCFRGDSEAAWFAYLERVVRTVALHWARRIAALKRGGPGVAVPNARRRLQPPGRGRKRWLVAGDPSPERFAVERQQWRFLVGACRWAAGPRRPRRNFTILCLALIQGWTSREIGELLELTPSAVDTLVSRARRRLARRGVELPPRTRCRATLLGGETKPAARSAIIASCSLC